jgi:hypothetical protein
MKVVCVHISDSVYMKSYNYTVGKQYDCEVNTFNPHLSVQESSTLVYVIKNDNGVSRSFNKTRFELCFIPLSEVRQDKLKDLGI